MNNGILLAVILIVVLIIMIFTKTIRLYGGYVLGAVFLLIGIYLYPASMWRNISIVVMGIGLFIEIITTLLLVLKSKKNKL